MQAFRYFLLISMIVHSATLWFHHRHGLLHGNLWLGMGLCVLGYGCLLGLSKRNRIAGLAFSSTLLFLALQHGFLDLRLQSWQGAQAASEEGIWVLFVFLFIPLFFLAWYNKRNLAIAYIFVSALADLGLGLWLQPHFAQYLPIALKAVLWRTAAFLLAGISLTHLLGRLRQANQAIQTQALASAQLSESRERNRIARELHDTLAHSLSALAVQLEAIDATWNDNHEQNRARITQALATTRQGLAETRRAIQNLQAHPLESLGLSEALSNVPCRPASAGTSSSWIASTTPPQAYRILLPMDSCALAKKHWKTWYAMRRHTM